MSERGVSLIISSQHAGEGEKMEKDAEGMRRG